MAGFFGLFNYEKEGPGISKNAPKKKTFIVFFETFFRNFWKFIPINLVYSLCSLPLITNGLASAGYTNVARNTARDKHSFGLSDYFDTIKKNWKQALGAGIINVLVVVVLIFDFMTFWPMEGWFGLIGRGISMCIAFIFLIMNFYIWTLIITFNFKLSQIYRNSFKFVFLNMKMNLLCGVVLLLCYACGAGLFILGFKWPIVFALLFIISICCFAGFRFLLIQYCTFPAIRKYIIDPYYAEHPDDDIELRRNLGLEIPGEDDEEDEDENEENSEENEEEDPDAPIFED